MAGRWLAWGAILLASAAAPAAARGCDHGHVFEDSNGDGRRQAGEPAIEGVRISDGAGIVSSDASGAWSGLSPQGREVFVIKPAGFQVAAGADGLPAFWRAPPAADAEPEEGACDFPLRRSAPRDGALKVIVSSDPQAGNAREVGYYANIVEHRVAAHRDAALGLTLGDIANDDLSFYPALNRATASLGVPWLHVAGNHDLDRGANDDHASRATWRRVFGPQSYAWEEREALFVMLDNVIALPGERPAYVGGLRAQQFAFLERLLAETSKDRLLVVGAHIPWFDTADEGRPPTVRAADRERLFALLRPFPNVLLLSGHRHTQRQFFHGEDSGWHGERPLHEYSVGAMSGSYWSGVAGADGNPVATMADGTPRGFAVMTVADGGEYRLSWHPTSLPENDPAQTAAMALHAPKALRLGAYPAWGMHANVFMGREGTRVEYRIDEGEWKPMSQVAAPDPRLLVENVRDDLAESLRSFDRSPEAEPSPHLWRGTLDTRLEAGAHRVEVRAFDDHGGGEHRAAIVYRLLEASP